MLKKTLSVVLDRIPESGIGETELAIETGIQKLADLRSRLNELLKQGQIEQCEENPEHWRRVRGNRIPDDAEVLELIPADGIDPVSIAVYLKTSVPCVNTALKRLKNQGRIQQKGEDWYKNDTSNVDQARIADNNGEIEFQVHIPEDSAGRISIYDERGRETGGETPDRRGNISLDTGTGELTYDELEDRTRLERKIAIGFYEAGTALAEIRDRALYRDKWKTFENYVLDRFGWRKTHAYCQIKAAAIYDELAEMSANSGHQISFPLPTAETQIRPLSALTKDDRQSVWIEAVERANNRVPSEAVVKKVVKEFQRRDPVPNPYTVGAIVTAKGKKGWFVVRDVNDFSCTCHSPLGQEEVFHHFDLKEIDYPADQRQFMSDLQERLSLLWKAGDRLDGDRDASTVKAIVQALALNVSGFFTDLQKTLLETAEKVAGVEEF
ncbi:hypothetical protein V0288_11160 [Pannus brasiliensis CCIBt3594]|uniref:MarR family transcriptional regulator n=1 Tax=Pannus brasiliensis CCIBt3594 TaxID=1427578 RepID=A0AAW9QW01_9CHRO